MKIVKTVPPKKTKSKKYMLVCKTCQKEENGFNYSKTTFVADYPNDFFSCISPRKYCRCSLCGKLLERSILARLRYLWYGHKTNSNMIEEDCVSFETPKLLKEKGV